MNIVLLQGATGDVEGPVVRVPFGNYSVEKKGDFRSCNMIINDEFEQELNSKLILSSHSSIKLTAIKAENLTVRFIREK